MKLGAVLKSVDGRVCEVELVHQPGGSRDKEYWMMVKPFKKTTGHFHTKEGELKEMALLRACLWVYQENKSKWWSSVEKVDVHEVDFDIEIKTERELFETVEETEIEKRQKAFRGMTDA